MTTLRWLLLLVLCVAIPAAFAADVKISALPAATSANTTDEYPANQSGTTNKVTGIMIASLSVANTTSGATATVGTLETWQVLDANCATNSTVTMATCMTTNTLSAGTYDFEYHVVYQSAGTGIGLRLEVGTTGTFSRFRAMGFGVASASGANLSNMGKQGFSVTSNATRSAANSSNHQVFSGGGVDAANSDELVTVQGSFNLSNANSSLFLQAASEAPAGTNIQVRADTLLILRKLR